MGGAKPQNIDPSRPRKGRGRGLRTTTGCITCRKRHLKCDEEKPRCRQCTRNKKSCTYTTSAYDIIIDNTEDPDTTRPNSRQDSATNDIDDQVRSADELTVIQPEQLSTEDGNESIEVLHARQSTTAIQEQLSAQTLICPPDASSTTFGASETSIPRNVEAPPLQSRVDSGYSVSDFNYTSPLTTASASWDQPVGVATARWFGMLATDADIELNSNIAFNNTPHGVEDTAAVENPFIAQIAPPQASPYFTHNEFIPGVSPLPALATPKVQQECQTQDYPWKASTILTLNAHEQALFDSFVIHISQWMDLFDPYKHFSSLVPRLALRNTGLLKAILALSTRQTALCGTDMIQLSSMEEAALQYYNETLHYVRRALQHASYHTSDELLATTLIISAFEMLGDGSSREWERHLQGVFWIQRAQVIHGDSGGLRGAIWWAWICQDVWAAFRDKRKVFSFWVPERSLRDLSPIELAARSVFVLARVIDFCAREGSDATPSNILSRLHTAKILSRTLDEWASLLTPEFSPLPRSEQPSSSIFQPIWIHPPAFGLSMQIHHATRILLLLNRPSLGGINEAMQRQTTLDEHVAKICGIAIMLSDYASSTLSSQCLFIAGLCTYDQQRRSEILLLIEKCRRRTGWPASPFESDLRNYWEGKPLVEDRLS